MFWCCLLPFVSFFSPLFLSVPICSPLLLSVLVYSYLLSFALSRPLLLTPCRYTNHLHRLQLLIPSAETDDGIEAQVVHDFDVAAILQTP